MTQSKPITKELWELLADLHRQTAWRGFVRSAVGIAGLWTLTIASMAAPTAWGCVGFGVLAGFFYSSIFVTTHDALHHTLTGSTFWDEVIPRIIAYPALWFHGLYKQLHLIHHRANGHDLTDPERPQFTKDEYARASRFKRFTIRHQLFFDMFVWGGFGFIGHHVREGIRFGRTIPRVRRALIQDTVGILAANAAIYATAIHYGVGLRYFLFFLITERIAGQVHQFRAWIEHYGLWGAEAQPLETQIYTARNIRSRWGSFYLNGLNYHSIHHAFPRLPYYHLAEGDRRLREWANKRGRPLPTGDGYLRTAWKLAKNPVLIDPQGGTQKKGRSPIAGTA